MRNAPEPDIYEKQFDARRFACKIKIEGIAMNERLRAFGDPAFTTPAALSDL